MQPGNPVVGGTVLRRPAIQSPNFVTTVSGWTINADGTAEFSTITVRGTVTSTSGGMSAALTGGVLLLTPSGLGTGTPGEVHADVPGDCFIYSGIAAAPDTGQGASVSVASADSTDAVTPGRSDVAISATDVILIAQTVTLNATSSSSIPLAHVTGLPLGGGSSTATIVAAVNNLYAALQSCAIIAP